jgi:hypothetical protein
MDQKPDFSKRLFFHKGGGGPLRKKKQKFFFEVSIFTHQSKALIKLLQKIVSMKSFRLIPEKNSKNYFLYSVKRAI